MVQEEEIFKELLPSLVQIGPVVSEEEMFKGIVDTAQHTSWS